MNVIGYNKILGLLITMKEYLRTSKPKRTQNITYGPLE